MPLVRYLCKYSENKALAINSAVNKINLAINKISIIKYFYNVQE